MIQSFISFIKEVVSFFIKWKELWKKKLSSSPKGSWMADNLKCVSQILCEEKKKVEERINLK
jgi:hypothetical protein